MSRIVSVILENIAAKDTVLQLVSTLNKSQCFESVNVFSSVGCENDFVVEKCNFQAIPAECDTRAKRKNYVNRYFKDSNFAGFLHVIEDNVKIEGDIASYANAIENVMDLLDYDVYFSTVTDACNYVYSKFNPRVSIAVDYPEFAKFNLPAKLSFTSNANTAYVIYNYSKVSDDLLRFDERFDIAMFFIIEYFARRRNTKRDDQLYYMNQYLSIPNETGVFKYINDLQPKVVKERMDVEDQLFKSSNINYASDNNIDDILVKTYKKLKSKV